MSLSLDTMSVLVDFTPAQRAKLAKTLGERRLDPGAALFAQGDEAHACYFVLGGEVRVAIQVEGTDGEQVSVLRRGALFGEVALIDGRPRSAGCTAGPEGARLAVLSRADFDRLYNAGDATAHAVMDVVLERLVRRLRGATALLMDVVGD